MWAGYECYLTACRDILGLRLPQHEAYSYWEQAAIHGGFRWMHPEFCMVCDFPEVLNIDEQNRPHCDDGPSHRWRDGWSLYYLHGVAVDEQLVCRPDTQTFGQIDGEQNQEIRSLRIERWPGGWTRYIAESGAKELDCQRNEIENTVEALYRTPRGDQRLVVTCPTGRIFALGVPSDVETCEQARRWLQPRPVRIVART